MSSLESTLIDNSLRTPRASQAVYDLPCGYLQTGDGGAQTLITEVELCAMTGEQEDLLSSKDVSSKRKMNAFLASCIKRLGNLRQQSQIQEAVPSLLVGDRTFLFFAIRRVSLGDDFPFRVKCPNCKATNVHPFDLASLVVTKMPEPTRRIYQATLPSGAVAEYKCLTGEDENRRDSLKKTLQPLSLLLFLRLTKINGEDVTPLAVRALSVRDRDYLRACFAQTDGGIETTVTLTCPDADCANVFEREIDPAQPSFFFPSETSAIWRRRSTT